MTSPIAYLNGRLVPAHEATLPIDDAGFALGVTVTEQLRTFGGRLFRPERHFQRLAHSLALCGIEPGIDVLEFGRIGAEVVAHNHALLAEGDDLGLCIFVTPGPYLPISSGRCGGATVGLHTFPLAFELWANRYSGGVQLVTTPVEQVPVECWPPEMKCRSRMHYYLADRQAARQEPGARALLLDAQGRVTETSTANILIYVDGTGLVSSPRSRVLPGVSLEVAGELAQQMQIPLIDRELMPEDVAGASEVMLTSTPNCLLPVTRFNGRPIGAGKPGPVFRGLLDAWSVLVGFEIAGQAVRFAVRQE